MTRLDSITLLAEHRISFAVIETPELLRTRRLVHWAAVERQTVEVIGASGTGKTTASIDSAAAAAAELEMVAVRVRIPHNPTKLTLSRELCKAIRGYCPDERGHRLRPLIVDA